MTASEPLAIIDETIFEIDWRRDLDHVVTFERDGDRYQKKLGDCDHQHMQAIRAAIAAYIAIGKAGLDNKS